MYFFAGMGPWTTYVKSVNSSFTLLYLAVKIGSLFFLYSDIIAPPERPNNQIDIKGGE